MQLTREEAQFHVKLSDKYDPIYICRNAHAYLLTPMEDGWEKVDYYSEAIFDSSGSIRKPEWIYVLVNRSIPGMCKIGFTTTSVPKRAKELNQSTGVPTPWFPVFSFKYRSPLLGGGNPPKARTIPCSFQQRNVPN